MSYKTLILLGAALNVAFAQSSPPTNVAFERWTSQEGELVKLDGLGRASRNYRVTALSRMDPNRPGYILEPYNGQRTPVRTYDQKVTLNSREKTFVEITYKPTQVAYLRIDYSHKDSEKVWMYWDGQPIYVKGSNNELNPVWLAVFWVTYGTIIPFWRPYAPGWFSTTIPIPLDGRVHTLSFGAGGGLLAFGPWESSYRFDSSRMQAGKIYWVGAHTYYAFLAGFQGLFSQKSRTGIDIGVPPSWENQPILPYPGTDLDGRVFYVTHTGTKDGHQVTWRELRAEPY